MSQNAHLLPIAIRDGDPQPIGGFRLHHIDGLRALAALMVLVFHCYLTTTEEGRIAVPHWFRLGTGWILYGHFAVSLFITLSGYCLMLRVIRDDLKINGGLPAYFGRRIRRIWPPYYAAVALSLLLIWTLLGDAQRTPFSHSVNLTSWGVLSHLLFVHNIASNHGAYGNPEINLNFWSIAVEEQIYLIFPMLVLGWRRLGAWLTLAATATVCSIVWHMVQSTRFMGLNCPYVILFTVGMLAATVATSVDPKWTKLKQALPWHWLAMVFAGIFIHQAWHDRIFVHLTRSEYLFGAWAFCLLVAISNTSSSGARLLSWSPLTQIGLFSYSLYLIQMPLIELLWQYAMQPLRLPVVAATLLLMVGGGTLVVAASYLFFLVFEKPFLPTPKARLAGAAALTLTHQPARPIERVA